MGKLQYIAQWATTLLEQTHPPWPESCVLRQHLPPANLVAISYAFWQSPVFLLIPTHLSLSLRSPRVIFAIGATAAAGIGLASYVLTRRKPTADEIERERRDLLAR